MSRTSYHTHVKSLAREGLLCHTVMQQIPRSNLYRWKAEHEGKYHDFGIIMNAAQDLEIIKSFAQHRSAKRIYAAYVRLIKTFISIVHSIPGFHKTIKEHSKKIIEVVSRVKNLTGLKRTLRLFNISVPTFRNWSLQSFTDCFESLTRNCNRVFPNQLSRPEVLKLKGLLSDAQYQFWPVSSNALHALRNNTLPLSLNTWYKYVNKFGLSRPRPASRRKKNAFSVRAQRPHEIWHADITAFVTADHVKHYIYLVVDNFSRKILSWKIADSVKAEFRRSTIEEALGKVNNGPQNITLITDGGPENKIKAFQDSIDYPIQQKIALVDVHYSNSLIEAHNKLIKYNYLYRMDIPDEHQLLKIFPAVVDDFNNRPHVSLDGLTPNEAEQNHALDRNRLRIYVQNATQERKKYNQIHRCTHCND